MKSRLILVLSGLIFLATAPLIGQGKNDLFLLDVTGLDGDFKLNSVRNLTQRSGYDNQPFFVSDSRVLYTSIREDGQADIYHFDLNSNTSKRITYTQESEYSPTLMPDGESFSVIRVEADGSQRLYAFPLDGGVPTLLLPEIKPVGYHVWVDSTTLGLFVLGEPNSLYLATLNGSSKKLVGSIGRGLQKTPGEHGFAFIHKDKPESWLIKKAMYDGSKMETIIQTLPGSEDFVWTKDGSLLMAQGSALFRFKPEVDESWVKLVDLSDHGLKGVTRLALSPNQKRLILISAL